MKYLHVLCFVAVGLAVLAALHPAAFLPAKVQIAVSVLGWKGFARTVVEVAATRALGAKETVSRSAWHTLIDTLTALDASYLAPDKGVVSEDDIGEGHMYALHLLATAIHQYAFTDPADPEMRLMVDKDRKFMGDNPDTIYFGCPLLSDGFYVLRGVRAGETYLSVTVYSSAETGSFPNGTVSDVNDSAMTFAPNGSYAIVVSRQRPPTMEPGQNWLALTDGPMFLVTRHYFERALPAAADPSVVAALRATLSIAPVVPAPPRPAPTAADIARRLTWISTFVRSNSLDRSATDTAPRWFALIPNTIGLPEMHQQQHGGKTGGFGAPDIAYAAGMFRLQPHESLVVTWTIPPCRFANVVLWNRYLQTFDYVDHQVSLNRRQLKGLAADLTVTCAQADESVNWLDSLGRSSGTIFIRMVLPTGKLIQPVARVVAHSG